MRTLLPALLLCLPCAAAAADGPPQTMPSFEGQATRPVLLVGDFGIGTHFPASEAACPKDRVCIRLNPPPFWFEVRVGATLYGDEAPATLYAAAGSHYGTRGFPSQQPQLAMFKTNGRDYLMQRYAQAGLNKKKNGDLYLLVRGPEPIRWLPCAVNSLREPIAPDEFVDNLEIARDDFKRYGVESNPTLFRLTEQGAVPLFGISMARLKDFVQPLLDAELSCK